MQIHTFDYRTERIQGKPLAPSSLVDILAGADRARIVYDTEGFLGANKDFGINYGTGGKKGFMHQGVEYVIDSKSKAISVSQHYKPKANLFYDADKRDSFTTYKIEFSGIDEVLEEFIRRRYKLLRE